MNRIKSLIEFNIKHNFLLNKKIKEIDKYYSVSDVESLKNERFLTLINKVSNNKFYKEFYKTHDIDFLQIKTYKDLKNLPILKKNDVKLNSSSIKSSPFLFKGYTSGTSGTPLVVYRDLKSIINENAYVWWYRSQFGLSPNDKKISLRGDLDKGKLFYYDSKSRTLYISSFNLNKTTFNEVWNKINEFKPKAMVGYPSSLFTLAELFKLHNKELKIPLAFTSSETLYPHQELLISDTFQAKICDWYGNSERTIALYRSEEYYYEPLLYSINNYKEDCVISTSLINDVFPLINYEVTDIIKTNGDYSEIKKSKIINKILGRSEGGVQLPDGSKIGSASLSLIFKDMDILNSQIIQVDNHNLIFNIVAGNNFKSEEELEKKIAQKLGTEINVKINKITNEEIIYTSAGKYNLVHHINKGINL
jgi:phenylacetate-CoA ligase